MVIKNPYKSPRGQCRYCGKTYALRKDGTLRFHSTQEGRFCEGYGKLPAVSTVTGGSASTSQGANSERLV